MALTELEWRERAVRWKGVDSERPDHRQICPHACWDFDYSSHTQSLSWAHLTFFLSPYVHKIDISSKSKLQSMPWLWTTSQKWDSDREGCRRNLFYFCFSFTPKSHLPSGNNTSVCLWGTNPILSISPCASGVTFHWYSSIEDGHRTQAWPTWLFRDFWQQWIVRDRIVTQMETIGTKGLSRGLVDETTYI